MMTEKPRLGFIGLGAMGLGMASCLAKSGFEVTGFDARHEAVERLVNEGGKAAESPRSAASRANILILVVTTSDQATSVLLDRKIGALDTLPQRSVVLLCITAAPEYVVDLGTRLRAAGRSDVRVLDCPISGGEVRAWQGTLSLLCAGEMADIEYSHDVVGRLSSKLHIIPGGIGAASSVKMVHQILVGVHIVASIEAMGLAYMSGLELQATYDAVMKSQGASWLFGQRAAHLLDEDKVPASSLTIITKDFAMLNASGQNNKVSLPMTSLTYQLFLQTSAAGWGTNNDCTVVNTYLLGRGGLQSLRDPRTTSTKGSNINEEIIINLLIGIHTVAAVEVLFFAKRLGIDTAVVRDFVKDAAGSSVIFEKVCEQLAGSSEVSLRALDDVHSTSQNLESSIQAAQSARYPLFLATMALQQFYRP